MPRRSSLELEVGPSLFLAPEPSRQGFSFLKVRPLLVSRLITRAGTVPFSRLQLHYVIRSISSVHYKPIPLSESCWFITDGADAERKCRSTLCKVYLHQTITLLCCS